MRRTRHTLTIALCIWLLSALMSVPVVQGQQTSEIVPGMQATVLNDSYTVMLEQNNTVREEWQRNIVVHNSVGVDLYSDPRFIFDSNCEHISPVKVETVVPDGRSINAPDRAINILTPHDLAGAPDYTNFKELICSFVGVEYGSTLNLLVQKQRHASENQINHIEFNELVFETSPVQQKVIRVTVPEEMKLFHTVINSTVEPILTFEDANTTYTWTFTNLKEYKYEHHSVSPALLNPRVIVSTWRSWEELLEPFKQSFYNQTIPEDINDKAHELVKDILVPAEKVRAIYDYVSTTLVKIEAKPTLFRNKLRPLADIYHSNYGYEYEQLLLFASMIRAIGGDVCLLFIGPRATVDSRVPTLTQFSETGLEVKFGRFCEWFNLAEAPESWNMTQLSSKSVLKVGPTGFSHFDLETIPSEQAYTECHLQSSLDETLKLKGTIVLDLSGKVRHSTSWHSDTCSALKNTLTTLGQDLTVESMNIYELSSDRLHFSCPFEVTLLSETLEDGLIVITLPSLNMPLNGSELKLFNDDRLNPIKLASPINEKWNMEIALPEGFIVKYQPPEKNITNTIGSLIHKVSLEENTLSIKLEYVIRNDVIAPEDRSNLQELNNARYCEKSHLLVLQKDEKVKKTGLSGSGQADDH
ncbi:DUF3857 domain-containing protein [bacterium]|nr:DUF3857 domain-containing protein [bacterium]